MRIEIECNNIAEAAMLLDDFEEDCPGALEEVLKAEAGDIVYTPWGKIEV